MNTHVNFDTAKLLKEKGFGMHDEDYIQLPQFYEEDGTYIEYDVHVSKKYNPHCTHLGADTIEDFEAHLTMLDNSLDDIYLAPTIAETIMWLYEKHGIWIGVQPTSFVGKFQFRTYWNNNNVMNQHWNDSMGKEFKSPTEASLEAVTYVLKNLIK